jgi:DNA-binding NtrC family response regulator
VIESTAQSSKLLVVSGDSIVVGTVLAIAAANRWSTEIATDAWDALDKMHAASGLDLLVLDLPPEPSDGLQILRALRRFRPTLAAVLVGYPGDLERKQEALRMGVRDYLLRPLENRQLELALRRNIRALESPQPFEGICGYKSLRSLLQSVKEEAEKNAIALALERTGWNRKAAARLLKTSYRSVLYKIEQYRMSSPDRPAAPVSDRTQTGMAELRDDIESGKPAFEFQRAASSRFDE